MVYDSLYVEKPNTEEYKLNYEHRIVLYKGDKIFFNLSFFLKNEEYDVFKESVIDDIVIKIIKDNIHREFYINDSAEPSPTYLTNIQIFLNICKAYNKKVTILTGQNTDDIKQLYKSFGADVIFLPLFNLFCYSKVGIYTNFYKENTLEKKYLTLNKQLKPIRAMLYHYLKDNDLLKFGEYSFVFDNVASFDENLNKQGNFEYVDSIVDKFAFNKTCFLNFVIETSNEDYFVFDGNKLRDNFVSEKTYKALYTGLPFILLGESNLITSLNSYGIKTFSDYWDESYDIEPDRLNRFGKAASILKDICYESESRLREIYNDTEMIHKHNVELVDSIIDNNLKVLKEKINL